MPFTHGIAGLAGLLLFAADSFGGLSSRFTVDHWDTKHGLPQNSVISMIQSRDGYLWVGTLNLLARFDGIQFTVFDESSTPVLSKSRVAVVCLFEDSKGNLWIGTDSAGVLLIKDGRVISVGLGRGGREGQLMSACEDALGSVWLYTANGELARYHNGAVDVWNVGSGPFSARRVIAAERPGLLWVGTDWYLAALGPFNDAKSVGLPVAYELRPTNRLDFLLASQNGGYWRLMDGHIQKCRTNWVERDFPFYPWTNAPIMSACEDGQGNLIVGTRGSGVWWFDADGKATQISSREGLSHDTILSVLVDREGDLWVGTDGGGLNRVKRQAFNTLEETRPSTVQSVCEDKQRGLWIGYNDHRVEHWDEGGVKQFGPDQGLPEVVNVRAIFVDRQRRVWVGTTLGGLFRLQESFFQQVTGPQVVKGDVLVIHEDRAGRLCVGSQGGLGCWDERAWKVFTASDGLPSNAVRAIADDADGNLWIGTAAGLARLRDGQLTSFTKTNGLPTENISSLFVDREGVLWIGTDGGGLVRFHQGKWTRYTKREGIISNSIGYLIEDDESNLWMGTYSGLMRVPKQALNELAGRVTNSVPCRVFGEADGLPATECTQGSQPAACRTPDGRLWFPTIKGLVSADPARLTRNTNPPPVIIESVLVEGQEQSTNMLRAGLPPSIRIPPGSERLEIAYTALNLGAADRARFKYRMTRHETDWTQAGKSRVARYIKLPPGEYRFQVIACNEDEVWNQAGSSLAITVLPPFWRTWWFLTASAVALLGLIVASVHFVSTQKLQRQLAVLRQQEALEKERARIARDLHDQLGASLTQVALLGELAETDKDAPEEVEAHARQISKTARETTLALDEIVWAANPSNDTLDGLITYVCKYVQEYLEVAGLRYRLDVPAQLPSAAIPPEVRHNVFLASKEAITNVVRHAQASLVWLRLRLEPRGFNLEIQDDGRGTAGLGEAAQTRSGLRNMRKRMEDIGGTFSIGPAPDGGTLVRLTVPLNMH